MPDTIFKYFPLLSDIQRENLVRLKDIYVRWNNMINVISRKDMDNFYTNHVLHSLAIAKVITFSRGTSVLDVGTGGGFPGIPLAILFPDSEFHLMDSIEKKIKVVTAVANELRLQNIIPVRKRVEEEKGKYDFIVSRAVTDFPAFVALTHKNIEKQGCNDLGNGILYLKGGDLSADISRFGNKLRIWNINEFFSEPFFETKRIVYLPV